VGVIIEGSNPKLHAHFGVSAASSLAGTTTSEDESGRESVDGVTATSGKVSTSTKNEILGSFTI
jgi:hypothetical protein